MVDKDGKMVKKVKPVLIKKELIGSMLPRSHLKDIQGRLSSQMLRGSPCILHHQLNILGRPQMTKITRKMKKSSVLRAIPLLLRVCWMKITFEELCKMLPGVLVTDIPKLIEETPLPYLTPLSKEMVQALQSVGEKRSVDLALHEEHSKGASQVSLMLKYGVTRSRLHKVITGTSRPGGS